MNGVYLDTNIFIYLTSRRSPYYKACRLFIRYCLENNISINTSTETIQEIIYLFKNKKEVLKGISIADKTVSLVDNLLPVSAGTIKIYLKQVSSYKTRPSRDLIHLSVCLENKISTLVTFDHEFKIFKGIKAYQPKDFKES